MDGLTEGRIVHYVMPSGEHRPAIVVKNWHSTSDDGYVNLLVFTDGYNDSNNLPESLASEKENIKRGLFWAPSVFYDADKKTSTWHWIERVEPEKKEVSRKFSELVDWFDYAQSAYNAYGAVTDHKNYQGLPMPTFDALTDKIKSAWIGAVKDVFRKLKVRDSVTNELFVE